MPRNDSFPQISEIQALPVTHEATVPEAWLDVMGHMNVMWYTHLFDLGVYGLFQRIGFDEAYMRERHGGSFALESHIRYLAEVRVGESVEIHTRVLGRTPKRFHVMNFMLKGEELSATFEVVGCYIDMASRRMAEFPAELAEEVEVLRAAHAQLSWHAPVCGVMGA